MTKDNSEATGAAALVDVIEKTANAVNAITAKVEAIEKTVEIAKQTQYPYGVPGGPHIRRGESALTSRPYRMTALAKAMTMKANNDSRWRDYAKPELELSDELTKAYYHSFGAIGNGGILVPLGASLMPTNPTEMLDGTKADGLPNDLVRKCREMMAGSMEGFDPDRFDATIRKDLSGAGGTTGGTLIGLASQGELIEQLKGMELMSRVGATQMDLPPQGRIRFPRQTSSVTISSSSESATISESTPGTGALELTAKVYTGLVDIPDELLRFATSVDTEAWLRAEFLRELSLKTDRDMIYGSGGRAIQGIINYGSVRLVVATTVATDGNTLEPQDLVRLYADIENTNAPTDRGFFYAMTPILWGGVTSKRASAVGANDNLGPFVFKTALEMIGGGKTAKVVNGYPVHTTTQIPTNRVKGSGTTLTILLGGVGSEWVIARAGVVELTMTNSDSSKFGQRINTMRGSVYMDAGPRHEESFGYIDTLLNQ